MTENKKQKMLYSIYMGPHANYSGPLLFIAYPDQGDEIADNLFGPGIEYKWYNDKGEIVVGISQVEIEGDIMTNPEGYKKYYGWTDEELKSNQQFVDDLCSAYWDTQGTVKEAMDSLSSVGLVDDYKAIPYFEEKNDYYAKNVYGWPDDDDVLDLTW